MPVLDAVTVLRTPPYREGSGDICQHGKNVLTVNGEHEAEPGGKDDVNLRALSAWTKNTKCT